MFLQKFDGNVTIWPKTRMLRDLWGILEDPGEERLGDMMERGERAVWGKVRMVGNRRRIEGVVERGREFTRGQAVSDGEGGLEKGVRVDDKERAEEDGGPRRRQERRGSRQKLKEALEEEGLVRGLWKLEGWEWSTEVSEDEEDGAGIEAPPPTPSEKSEILSNGF